MINDLRKINEEEMLRSWALAETVSTRRWKYLVDVLPPEILEKVRRGQHEFSAAEWQKLVEMIRNFRAPLLDGLLQLEFEWYEGSLPMEELKELRIMNWQPFVNLAGSRRLVDLVQAFQQGNMPPDHHEFAENLERIKKDFGLGNMHGKSIVVSKSKQPPYLLVEGFTRLSAALLNMLAGKLYTGEMPIILGISERLDEWGLA